MTLPRLSFAAAALALGSSCQAKAWPANPPSPEPPASEGNPDPGTAPEIACADRRPMTVRFYDVGQGLAVLVELPDGRHVLVDAGDEPHRSGCGVECASASAHLLSSLQADLHGAPIDLMWITHPHSDHVGGVPGVVRTVPVRAFVDDGRDGSKEEVRRARRAARERGRG